MELHGHTHTHTHAHVIVRIQHVYKRRSIQKKIVLYGGAGVSKDKITFVTLLISCALDVRNWSRKFKLRLVRRVSHGTDHGRARRDEMYSYPLGGWPRPSFLTGQKGSAVLKTLPSESTDVGPYVEILRPAMSINGLSKAYLIVKNENVSKTSLRPVPDWPGGESYARSYR